MSTYTNKLEIDIQHDIESYLNEHRIFHFRPNGNGLPDVIVCYKGRFIGLELKKPKTGQAQGHQKTIRKEIKENGGISEFPRSLDDIKKILRKVDNDTIWER